jgi:hypothetical protein
MSSDRVRKNLLGSVEPQSRPKEIRDLLNPEYYNKVNLRPSYQRKLQWLLVAYIEFIGIIMNTGLVQSIIMYQLFNEDKVEGDNYNYECVDGQHRLWTLNAFKTCSVNKLDHIKKPFIVHWVYEKTDENGHKFIQRVFYKDTPEVRDWFGETYPNDTPYFLTPEEKEHFDNFTINVTMLRSQLSLDQRRDIFTSLQKGVPVRNSDFLKNLTRVKLMNLFETNGYCNLMDTYLEYCSRGMTSYWIHWAAKLWLLFNEPCVDTLLLKDSAIEKGIKNNNTRFNPSEEEFQEFDNAFRRFLEYLQRLPVGIQFNAIQLFAMFTYLSHHVECIDVLITHMPSFSSEGQTPEYKNLWLKGNGNTERCRIYFNECLSQLESMIKPYIAIEIDTRKISKKLRMQVLAKAEIIGACDICGDSIDIDTCEAGHILARKKGGTIDIDNLIPLCVPCNRGMGVQNPYDYKKILPYNRV